MITHITSTMKLFGTNITQIYQFDDTNQTKMNLYESDNEKYKSNNCHYKINIL